MRDMRLMDSALGTETLAQLLVRDNALVFSMEHVRLIIMHDKVRRADGPAVAPIPLVFLFSSRATVPREARRCPRLRPVRTPFCHSATRLRRVPGRPYGRAIPPRPIDAACAAVRGGL